MDRTINSIFISACELNRSAPVTASFQPVSAVLCSSIFNVWPHVQVAAVSPCDAEILRATNRIGGVPPVCHLYRGKRDITRLSEEALGTRPEYGN